MTRDQQRAVLAYRLVGAVVDPGHRKDYRIAVHAFGANLLRSGLAGAMSDLERRGVGGQTMLSHLVEFSIPPLRQIAQPDGRPEPVTGTTLPAAVRALPLADYILATREMLKVVSWLKRAVQATLPDE